MANIVFYPGQIYEYTDDCRSNASLQYPIRCASNVFGNLLGGIAPSGMQYGQAYYPMSSVPGYMQEYYGYAKLKQDAPFVKATEPAKEPAKKPHDAALKFLNGLSENKPTQQGEKIWSEEMALASVDLSNF